MDQTNQYVDVGTAAPVVTEYSIYHLNEDLYSHGYVIGDFRCVPLSSYFLLTWDTLCSTLGVPHRSVSVEFSGVTFHHVLLLEECGAELVIGVQKGSGMFEISSNEVTLVSGIIKRNEDIISDIHEQDLEDVAINSETIYRILALKGHSYRGKYRCIKSMNSDKTRATLNNRDYDLVIESMFQMMMMNGDFQEIKLIQNLTIDVNKENPSQVAFLPECNIFRCGGIQVKDTGVRKSPINKYIKLRRRSIVCKEMVNPELKKPETFVTKCNKVDNSISIKVLYVSTTVSSIDGFNMNDLKGWTGFSGITEDGSLVMGVLTSPDGVSVVDPELTWTVPPPWTLEEAVTVPLHYVQALYLLRQIGTMDKCTSTLFNGVTSPLGVAIVNVLGKYKGKIFINSGNHYQRNIEDTLFENINGAMICDESEVMKVVGDETHGAGCDAVITLGDSTRYTDTMKYLSTNGCHFNVHDSVHDINKDETNNTSVIAGKSYRNIHISAIFQETEANLNKYFHETLLCGIHEGWVHPLPYNLLNGQQNSTTPRVNIIRLCETASQVCLDDGCYVVVCARRNLGVDIVDTLVQMGARKVTINTPEPGLEYLQVKLIEWRLQGIQLKICSENVISTAACLTLLSRASELGPVRGVFVVVPPGDVQGNHYAEMDIGVTRLDTTSQRICQHLEYFVVFTPQPKHSVSESRFENIFHRRGLVNLHMLEIQCLDNDTKGILDESVLIEVLSLSLTTTLKDLHTLLKHKLCVVSYFYSKDLTEGNNHEQLKVTDDVYIEKKTEDKSESIRLIKSSSTKCEVYGFENNLTEKPQMRINTGTLTMGNIQVSGGQVSDDNESVTIVSKRQMLENVRVEDIVYRSTASDENSIS